MNVIEARRAFYGERPRECRVTTFQLQRRDEGEVVGFDGYASLTAVPYAVTDWLGDYTETIERGAFGKALAERDDVRLLVNHEGIPIARTASGTMLLTEDERGLHVDVPELDMSSPLVQTVRSALARQDMNQMSFAFKATRQSWNEDYTERTISEVRLFDTSVVTYPASPTTTAKLRGIDMVDAIMRKVREGQRVSSDEFETLTAALLATDRGRDADDAGEQQPETDLAPRLRYARARAAAAGI